MKEFQKVTQEKILKNQKKQENKENSKNILIEI